MSDLTPEGLRKRAVEFMDREFNPEDPQTMTEALARVTTYLTNHVSPDHNSPDGAAATATNDNGGSDEPPSSGAPQSRGAP